MVTRAALLVGGAKVIGGASMLLLNIWVARSLAPAEYGVFAMATAAVLLLDGIVGSAVDASVVRIAGETGGSAVGAGRAGLVLKVMAGVGLTVLAIAVLAATRRPDVARLAALIGLDDPRVTRVGKWLRKSTLDELPNLWNVLTGEVAFVGPRPEIPEMLPYYDRDQLVKFSVRPGVTGLAQVCGRGDLSFRDTVGFDVEYVRRRALRLDLEILMRTVACIAVRKGAF